jgi:hypothetical protein
VIAHPVRWQAPQPLWARFGEAPATAARAPDQARPAILRFDRDDFMEQMLGTLARDPSRLDRLIARPETWRAPMAPAADLVERTAIPRLAQGALRTSLARVAKAAVPATTARAEVREQAVRRVQPLKLYQPAHQRFYLVAASLVCALPGWPERAFVPGGAEQVSFVLRRLLPRDGASEDLVEFAYVKEATAARWVRVGEDPGRLVAGEETLPLFPLAYQDDGSLPRKLWSGVLPVGRREEYVGTTVDQAPAPPLAAGQRESVRVVEPSGPPVSKRARLAQFQMEVAEPWKNLVRSSYKLKDSLTFVPSISDTEPAADKRRRVFEFNLQQQNASWLILLDFADYLEAHLPEVWAAVRDGGAAAASLVGQPRALYDWLGAATMPAALATALKRTDGGSEIRPPLATLRDALKAVRAEGVREGLEATELIYTDTPASLTSASWPPFHFVLAGLDTTPAPNGPFKSLGQLATTPHPDVEADPARPSDGGLSEANDEANKLDRLTALVGRALEPRPERDAPPLPFALQLRDALAANAGDAGWFVVRFVYARRDCGPLHPPLVSDPSQRFQLASFFDPDAPARPLRITMPMDTSPAGLRKFSKSTAFVLSDMLCGQVQRAKGLGFIDLVLSVLPWPLHKDLSVGAGGACKNGQEVNIGMICSLSIPIITICALILLMIIVSLLDFVFRWLPFFVICFPVPGLKGKR